MNAFVLKARQPVLVDTGLHQDSPAFMKALESVIDPADLRWIWLTHPDQDHVGSLQAVLATAPKARLVTNFLGLGILSTFTQVPMDRVYLLNEGEKLDVGDRYLTALRPPTFDNPSTSALIDSRTGTLFSSDCFGAVLAEPAQDATEIDAKALTQGQVLWATVDSPWLHKIDQAKFAQDLNAIRQLAPDLVLSSHLPPARSMTERLLASLAQTPSAAPFVGPNQAALEAMLASMTTPAPDGAT